MPKALATVIKPRQRELWKYFVPTLFLFPEVPALLSTAAVPLSGTCRLPILFFAFP